MPGESALGRAATSGSWPAGPLPVTAPPPAARPPTAPDYEGTRGTVETALPMARATSAGEGLPGLPRSGIRANGAHYGAGERLGHCGHRGL